VIQPPESGWVIGLMSGTSTDAVDGVLVRFEDGGRQLWACASASEPLPAALRQSLIALNRSGINEIDRSQRAALELMRLHVRVVDRLLVASGLTAAQVLAMGVHGQTVRHQPQAGYTVQLNAPAHLAEQTGIAVVSDFRSRDVAAGGQGAPLIPAFHACVFGGPQPVAVLNLGGMGNLSLLPAQGSGKPVLGFDTGPGNVLLDAWIQHCQGLAFDADGQWAAQGRVLPDLLDSWLASEPYFSAPLPKSTGRERFDLGWLLKRLDTAAACRPEDVQRTLVELTARSVRLGLDLWDQRPARLLVCGGGARNRVLMQALQALLPSLSVQATDAVGIPAQDVEAFGFAWLAWQFLRGLPGNLPAVTGARGLRVLGSYTPA
jgi:anhydro-N-acetylmuramic acid kinase